MDRTLLGGKVQRIILGRLGVREITLLQVRVPGETVYVLVAGGQGIGTVDAGLRERLRARMPENAPNGGQSFWRPRLEGARIASIDEDTLALVGHGEERATKFVAKPASATGEPVWTVVPATAETPPPAETSFAHEPADREPADRDRESPDGEPAAPYVALRARGTQIAETLLRGAAESRSGALRRALTRALQRIDRRIEAIRGDLAKMDTAEDAGRRAQAFVVAAARAPRGTAVLRAVDWSSGTEETVEWKLDPGKTAREQIEATFRRARRMKEGARIAAARLHEAQAAHAALTELARELSGSPAEADANTDADADPNDGADAETNPTGDADATVNASANASADEICAVVEARARAAAPHDFKFARPGGSPREKVREKLPYRTFLGPSQRKILVGRNAEHNDALTTRVARPQDLWLHAKGWAGAHVVVPLDKGASCPPDTLVEAAHLAAHFSEARGENMVEVVYTPRRYVRKPRGSAPGAVVVDREKVLVLRSSGQAIKALLASEVENR